MFIYTSVRAGLYVRGETSVRGTADKIASTLVRGPAPTTAGRVDGKHLQESILYRRLVFSLACVRVFSPFSHLGLSKPEIFTGLSSSSIVEHSIRGRFSYDKQGRYMGLGLLAGKMPPTGRGLLAARVRPRALSISQTGHMNGHGQPLAFDSSVRSSNSGDGSDGSDGSGGPSTLEDQAVFSKATADGSGNTATSNGRRQGASCEWPRACAWPMKEQREASEIAQSAMADAAAAAALSNSMDWTPEAKVYTMNEQVDADLPPDVELLAYFSDSPISWKAHEHYSEDDEWAGSGAEGERWVWQKTLGQWFSKMWRYQGLG